MDSHIRKNIVRMAATSIVASSVLAMAGPAQARTSEHILLSRQVGVTMSSNGGSGHAFEASFDLSIEEPEALLAHSRLLARAFARRGKG